MVSDAHGGPSSRPRDWRTGCHDTAVQRRQPRRGPAEPVGHRHRPRRASPSPTSTRRSRSTAAPSACPACTSEVNEEQGVARGDDRPSAKRVLHPAAAPLTPDSTIAQVPRPQRPGHPAGRLPGRRHRRRSRAAARRGAAAALRRARDAAPPARGSTSSTPRTPAACWSSWSSPARRSRSLRSLASVGDGREHVRRPAAEADVKQILDAILAGDGARTSPACRSPSPTARSPCTRTRRTMFEGLASRDKDPRRVAARRGRADCPSSARARRSSR